MSSRNKYVARRRDERITFYVTADMKEKLERLSQKEGVSLSLYISTILVNELKQGGTHA